MMNFIANVDAKTTMDFKIAYMKAKNSGKKKVANVFADPKNSKNAQQDLFMMP